LAGWLFADLALVLGFVFLDSTITRTSAKDQAPTTTSTTTTTLVKSISGSEKESNSRGVRPVPMVVTFKAGVNPTASEVWNRIEKELSSEAKFSSETKFLVVIVHGGAKGRRSTVGDELAAAVINKIDAGWSHISSGLTYFDKGHDNSIEPGFVRLKLFPIVTDLANP
jgi:hypothetical protein